MKLLTKTTIYYMLISCLILLVAGIVSYFMIQAELTEDELETVQQENSSILKLIESGEIQNNSIVSPDGFSKVEKILTFPISKTYMNDTSIWDPLEKENIQYKTYNRFINIHGLNYKITLAKNQHLRAEFFENLMFIIGLILVLIIFIFLTMNWFISRVTWKPFYNTLGQLKAYSIDEHMETQFESTKIYEFNALNSALTEMTGAVYKSYQAQKEFTENASHEMQTPVAILKSNLEMLMQSENLNEKDITYIEGIESGISKLSKLNSSLLLLAKIENNQFNVKSIINIRTVIRQVLQQYEVEIDAKNILIINQLNYDFNIVMEPNLAEILFRNLISNAIQYNINHGKIFLDFNENTFTIKNTGNPIDFNSTEIFSRFKKGNTSIQSTGLGLSIVKSIALCHGFIIDYGYENKLHIFNLILKKP